MAPEIDPELAEMLGTDDNETEDSPDFGDLFEDEASNNGAPDLSIKTFTVPQQFEGPPNPVFKDKEYYKKVLTGEGEASKKLHQFLATFLKTEDPQERSMFRSRIIPVAWEIAGNVAAKISGPIDPAKIAFLRYGLVLPTMISPEQRTVLSKIIFQNATGESLYYVDEWLIAVAKGRVSASAQDETKVKKKDDTGRLGMVIDKTQGKYDAQLGLITNRALEMESQENILKEQIDTLTTHEIRNDVNNSLGPFTEAQRNAMNQLSQTLRRIGSLNKELTKYYSELDSIKEQLDNLKEKEAEMGDGAGVDSAVVVAEMNTVRQMAKLCVGRQGNHFPLLMKQYMRASLLDIATRENVIKTMAEVETLDPGVFLRTFKQTTNRIVPNTIIIPCYGDRGVCWEPFEKFNRATGKGRICIPLYPKEVKLAIVAALGDLRWQVAKEKAQHYWMEEGLTGWYYQYFTDAKLKGDVREAFINDYILWITKESVGTQKLERGARSVLWRYCPFPQDVKDDLKNRGFVYSELYKKDQNRAMSDGY